MTPKNVRRPDIPPVPVLLLAILLAACGGGSGSDATVVQTSETEPNDSIALAQDLGAIQRMQASGLCSAVAASGGLAAGDPDYYRVSVPAPGRLALALECSAGSDLDLTVFDALGQRLATSRSDNNRAEVGAFEYLYVDLPSAGAWFLQVAGYTGAPGPYLLDMDYGAFAPPVGAATVGVPVQAGNMATTRAFHDLAVLPGGWVLAAGGSLVPGGPTTAVLSATATTEFFDAAAGVFRAGPDMRNGRFGLTATALPTGRVLLAGGDLQGTADLFDPWSGDRIFATNFPMAGSRLLHTATLLQDGRVLLAGGVGISGATRQDLTTSEIYDPKTRAFAAGPTLLAMRVSHAAVLLADGRVLLAGGEGRSDSEVLDLTPTVYASAPGPLLSSVRDDLAAVTLLDGSVLVTGGQNGTGRSLDTAEVLDRVGTGYAATFRSLTASMNSHRADHQALRLRDGRVLILGGEDDPGSGGHDTVLNTVEVYDPATGTFTTLTNLRAARDDHRAALLPDGRVLVTGGQDANTNALNSAELYLVK